MNIHPNGGHSHTAYFWRHLCNECARMRCSRALDVALLYGMMGTMDSKWTRLGGTLKAARVKREMEQQSIATQIGVKRGALHNIEKGSFARVTPTVLAYARLVGWTPDSVQRVLDGHPPVLREEQGTQNQQSSPAAPDEAASPPAPAVATPPPAPSDLSVRVQQALREGPLIDSRVQEVTTASGRVKATIVVRGEEGTPPEQLLAVLRALKVDVSIEDS